MSDTTFETAASSSGPDKFHRALFAAVWMAIILGLVVQSAVFAAKLLAGGKVPGVQFLVDVASGVTWSVVVCGGVAVGTVAAKSAPQIMGALGLICAPLAFAAAKGAQQGLAWVLGPPMDQINALTYQIGGAKAVEYAALGIVLGAVIRTPRSTLANHALIGAAFGVVFGALILWLNLASLGAGASLPQPRAAATAVNEFIFPIGCSLVIYWVARLSGRSSAKERIISGGS